jgi:hypothetical protein
MVLITFLFFGASKMWLQKGTNSTASAVSSERQDVLNVLLRTVWSIVTDSWEPFCSNHLTASTNHPRPRNCDQQRIYYKWVIYSLNVLCSRYHLEAYCWILENKTVLTIFLVALVLRRVISVIMDGTQGRESGWMENDDNCLLLCVAL